MSKEGEPREDYRLQAPVFRQARSVGNPLTEAHPTAAAAAHCLLRPSRARTLVAKHNNQRARASDSSRQIPGDPAPCHEFDWRAGVQPLGRHLS